MPTSLEVEIPAIRDIVALLAVAVAVVVALKRLEVSPVLGFLIAGAAVGPFGLAWIGNVGEVGLFAAFGVVFLLFMIGLELSRERLRTMWRYVFGLGLTQLVASGLAIGAIAYAWGNALPVAALLGACLALSSTAVVIELLAERGEIATRAGRVSLGILLLQDLAVVPLLVVVSAPPSDSGAPFAALGWASLIAAVAIAAVLGLGRIVLRWPFRFVTATKSPELFMAFTLLIVLGTGWATHAAGLSLALGAFLAGLVIAETEFRHQVEADIKPFKGLLLGLFFMAMGMTLDFDAIADETLWIALSVVGLIAIKGAIVAASCLAFGLSRGVAVRAAFLLGPGGEFAFVVIGTAMTVRLIDPAVGQFMFAVAGFSILLTPVLAAIGARVGAWLERADERRGGAGSAPERHDHVVIAGYGRVGQRIAELLKSQNLAYVAVDLDADRVREGRRRGVDVYYGDVSRREVLERLGIARAAAAVVTVDSPETTLAAVTTIKAAWPALKVYARARDEVHARRLEALGVDGTVLEALEPSLDLARRVLVASGIPAAAVGAAVDRARTAATPEVDRG